MTARWGQRSQPVDALGLLAVYVVILLAVPSRLIFQPLGAAGTPAQLIGIGLLAIWLLSRLLPRRPVDDDIGPVKWLLLAFVLTSLLGYAVGAGLPRMPEEVRSADRALLTLAGWAGVTLAVSDGLVSRQRLDRLLKVLAVGATGIAVLGMVQFFLGIDIAQWFTIPGLSPNHSFGGLVQRSSFRRVSGTTVHPIEFGVVLSAVLPLLVHYAIHSRPAVRARWWMATGIVAVALPMSVARTAILGAGVAVLVAFWGWPRPVRRRLLLLAPVGFVGMQVMVPGLLGTIKSLFLNATTDPSTTGRTADYAAVWYYFTQQPVIGRGLGTFIPSLYRTLDNQYLGTLVETGLVGLLSLLALLAGSILVALTLRRRLTDPVDRSLALALAAGVAVPLVSFVTFDGLSFPMAAGITFLLLGAVASLWRLERLSRAAPVPQPALSMLTWLPRTAGVAVLVVLVLAPYGTWILARSVDYRAGATLLVDAVRPDGTNPYLNYPRSDRAATILQSVLTGPTVRDRMDRQFRQGRYGVAVGYTSLEQYSDALGAAPSLRLRAIAPSAEGAEQMRAALLDATDTELLRIQEQAGVPAEVRLLVRPLEVTAVTEVRGSRARMSAALGAVLVIVVGAAAAVLRYRPRPRLPGKRAATT